MITKELPYKENNPKTIYGKFFIVLTWWTQEDIMDEFELGLDTMDKALQGEQYMHFLFWKAGY